MTARPRVKRPSKAARKAAYAAAAVVLAELDSALRTASARLSAHAWPVGTGPAWAADLDSWRKAWRAARTQRLAMVREFPAEERAAERAEAEESAR